VRQPHQPMRGWLARLAPFELLARHRLPQLVDDLDRISVDLVSGEFEVLGPQS